ncbi:solute carrier family 35 member G1 [Contarinia nasturtii]|uniref:solute carrier family 35 member G1 n=1 Tax=Contarinia nasturtii TaxID=265458 RepID=UPI0012D3F40C|nr:solute carrier family 35 member G1 [Contarinia nasturtii]
MSELLELHQLVDSDAESHQIRRSKMHELMHSCYSCSFLGILLATLSSFFFSLCSVIVKELVDINPVELASFRFIGVLLPSIPILVYKQEDVFPSGKRTILLLRCFVGTTGLILSFYAFRHMPLADASVIIFSTPVFVAIFANLFLKEPCGLFNAFTILLTLFGVVLITRPSMIFGDTMSGFTDELFIDDEHDNMWGAVAAIASTLFGANAYVTLRALKGIHYSVIMSNFGAFGILYTVIVCWFMNVLCMPYCNSDRWMVVALGAFSFLGQILLTISLQLEEAGPVAIARSADIVFAFFWQTLFFKEIPNGYSIVGAIIVTTSVILTGLKRWSQTLPRESMMRKRLRYILLEVWI